MNIKTNMFHPDGCGGGTKEMFLKFYTDNCDVIDDDAYDDLEFALDYLTNPDMRRVFAEHDAEPRSNYIALEDCELWNTK